MAQTIKHRRGKLESIASQTPINGELIIASGSDLAVHQEGLLFVGVEGNVSKYSEEESEILPAASPECIKTPPL